MNHTRKSLRSIVVAGLVLALALSACGDDDGGGGSAAVPSEFAPPTAAPDDAQKGGTLKVLANGDVDYMDPGAAYYQFTYMITGAGHRTLVSYDPDDVDQPTPDGAVDQPDISDDGLKITYTIREGMNFAPPVDREITAADYEYAIERAGELIADGWTAHATVDAGTMRPTRVPEWLRDAILSAEAREPSSSPSYCTGTSGS